MATIGWVKVGYAVDLGGLAKGSKSASSIVSGWADKVKGLIVAYAGFAAIKGMGEYVKSTIESIGATKILAERIGWSSESFQKLAYAAKLAHVDQDTLATSLGQMSKRLAEVAIEGAGPAADVLQRFGLDARQLTAMGPEKAFGVLLNVFQRIQNPMERSAVAMDLFGKSGQGMINLIAQGGPEIDKLGEEASRLGIALNGVQAAKAVEAEEAMIKLTAAGEGFANLLAVELAPYLTLIVEKYTEWGYAGQKSGNFVKTAMDWAATGIGVVVDAVHVLEAGFYGLLGVGNLVAMGLVTVFQGFIATIEGVVGAVASVASYINEDLGKALAGAQESIGHFAEGVAGYKSEIAKNTESNFAAASEAISKVGQGRDTVKGVMDSIQNAATSRAKDAADKSNKFIEPGELNHKHEEVKFSAAQDINDKSTYSTILAAKGLQSSAQQQLATNTKITADATTQSVVVLKEISKSLTSQGAGGALKLQPDS